MCLLPTTAGARSAALPVCLRPALSVPHPAAPTALRTLAPGSVVHPAPPHAAGGATQLARAGGAPPVAA
eukprot:CAMPEP_0118934032 /NCGR_PEP_ID=MMETSP1169-20130426/13395_1 /TAXON_ID=36882 /ORGANISM="Pyramimonas obovata, Strain CCMP722" /LENGTH=68 /DNA_ID=CAMNT_0006876889 /DNA_START=66 /DNA_END=269 /DNA_ORIENTATION=-